MSLSETPDSNVEKNRRIPNAFMLFVKEQKKILLQKFPNESKESIAALQGKMWRSLSVEEKEVYYDKYRALKRLKAEKHDLNLAVERKTTDNDDIVKFAANEFNIHTSSKKIDMIPEPNQQSNKQTVEELHDDTFKKSKIDSSIPPNIDDLSSNSGAKQKPLKKVRRPPNAFICFAKEHRSSVDLSMKKDKKCHANSILGNMWRELSNSEKNKYYEESRRQLKLYKESQATTPSKILKKKSKLPPTKDSKRTVRSSHSRKKVKFLPGASLIESHQIDASEKLPVESDSKKLIADTSKVENVESSFTSSEPPIRVSNEYDSTYQLQHSITKSSFHRKIPPTEAQHSSSCCCQSTLSQNYNNNCTLNRYSPFDSGMSTSCFGAGSFPPFFPSYPPFFMYQHQQAMSHHMHPFQQPSFFPSPCSCSLPAYPFNTPYSNSYFNTYSNLYSGRCAGAFPYVPHPSSSATSACTVKEENPAELMESTENSDELLVVDEKDTDGDSKDEVP